MRQDETRCGVLSGWKNGFRDMAGAGSRAIRCIAAGTIARWNREELASARISAVAQWGRMGNVPDTGYGRTRRKAILRG
jgi:hypothetical protein